MKKRGLSEPKPPRIGSWSGRKRRCAAWPPTSCRRWTCPAMSSRASWSAGLRTSWPFFQEDFQTFLLSVLRGFHGFSRGFQWIFHRFSIDFHGFCSVFNGFSMISTCLASTRSAEDLCADAGVRLPAGGPLPARGAAALLRDPDELSGAHQQLQGCGAPVKTGPEGRRNLGFSVFFHAFSMDFHGFELLFSFGRAETPPKWAFEGRPRCSRASGRRSRAPRGGTTTVWRR